MARSEKTNTDIVWEEMKNLAIEQQQCFYEFLPNCKVYQHDEHKYLKYDIGCTIYGPPKIEDANTAENNYDIADIADYDKKRDVITIYNKIIECLIETGYFHQPIYMGIIYNIIFRPKIKSNIKTEEKKGKEKEEFMLVPTPVFKIRKSTWYHTTWYIDSSGRVYKDWTDYITNNNLPKCTMVIPKDGYYQPDKSQPITEDYSTVYLDIIDSPACKLSTKLCKGIDTANNVISVVTIALGITAMLTPLAPIVAASGLVATGATSAWIFARCCHRLYDRKTHKGSLLDKDSIPQWFGIAGTTFGLGTIGGTMYISKIVERGVVINNTTKIIFNGIQGGNLLFNGAGIAHQCYSITDKYKTDKTIDSRDIIYLLAHIAFFTGSVIKVEFAEATIKNTQAKIIDDYAQNLPNRRFRKSFNRAKRNAAAKNSGSKISENAQVIRYIKNCTQLFSSDSSMQFNSNNLRTNQTSSEVKSLSEVVWTFEGHKLRVNGIELFDPIEFVRRLKHIPLTELIIRRKTKRKRKKKKKKTSNTARYMSRRQSRLSECQGI